MSAADRMQHFDAYIDPVTHQMQQTIYLARRNAKPKDNTDLYEIISWTEPEAAADDARAGQVQAEAPYGQFRPYDMLKSSLGDAFAHAEPGGVRVSDRHERRHVDAQSAAASRRTASRSACCSR